MRSQLRLQVVLPLAVLGVLGLAVGAFAVNGSGATPDQSAEIAARIAAQRAAAKRSNSPKATEPKHAKPARQGVSSLEQALRSRAVVVVLFYEPGASYDGIQTREARAGALAAQAGFVAVDVSKNREVAPLASKYEVKEAPAIVFVTRRGVAGRIDGFADRATVAQAAQNARP